MKTKLSFVADCRSSVQYMFHREQRYVCRRPDEISTLTNAPPVFTSYVIVFKLLTSHDSRWNKHAWGKFEVLLYRSQWPRSLRRRSAASRLQRLWFRIPSGALMSICCECWVLSGRGVCDELITRPEESYRLWCVVACDLETSWMRRPWPIGAVATTRKWEDKDILLLFHVVTDL